MAKTKAKASKGKAKPAAKKSPANAKGAKKAAPKKAAKPAKKAAAKPAKKATAPAKKAAAKKAAPTKAAAKKAAPKNAAAAKSATKTASDAYTAAVEATRPAPNGDVILGALRLDNYRKPFSGTADSLSEGEKTQLTAVVGADTFPSLFGAGDDAENEMAWLEYMDVIDTKSGTIVANLLIWPYGDGAVVHHGTTKMIASIVQHGINPHETTGKAWMADFAKAWAEGAPRLGVSSPSHFGFGSEQTADADDE
ncbi:MAG: hypothetical protein ACKV2T_37150 [Kofleriaceae bacterium]